MLDELLPILSELASDSPAPGGGSAAAIAGALSAALGSMIAKLALSRERYKEKWDDAERLRVMFDSLSKEFRELAEQDAQAYLGVVEERQKKNKGKRHALEVAEKRAALVPLRTEERALDLLRLLVETEELGLRAATSDLFVALSLARAAFFGGKANVLANLPSLETSLAKEVEAKATEHEAAFEKLHADIEFHLKSRLGFHKEG